MLQTSHGHMNKLWASPMCCWQWLEQSVWTRWVTVRMQARWWSQPTCVCNIPAVHVSMHHFLWYRVTVSYLLLVDTITFLLWWNSFVEEGLARAQDYSNWYGPDAARYCGGGAGSCTRLRQLIWTWPCSLFRIGRPNLFPSKRRHHIYIYHHLQVRLSTRSSNSWFLFIRKFRQEPKSLFFFPIILSPVKADSDRSSTVV